MPDEREIEGVSLKGMIPGTVRDVSPVLASWLIAEEYADCEMRRAPSPDEQLDGSFNYELPRERRARTR
jgi:hypothetical protein